MESVIADGVIWVLGASDPEMESIEGLLRSYGQRFVYAQIGGQRVRPDRAYCADFPKELGEGSFGTIYRVECGWEGSSSAVVIDHHSVGDPGYGVPPVNFWEGSSIGQVFLALERGGHFVLRPITAARMRRLRLAAAADHCLAAAYRGECPGIDIEALLHHRVKQRSLFQRRPVEAILADVEATGEALREAPEVTLCTGDGEHHYVKDMRRDLPWPELVEAACRVSANYISGPLVLPDGRVKFTVSGAPGCVRAWLQTWAPAHGIEATYGDPVRGFAGGYLAKGFEWRVGS